MLEVKDQTYFDEVKAYAEKIGATESLKENLDYLETYACTVADKDGNSVVDSSMSKCVLFRDVAPQSFYFVMYVKGSDGQYKRWFDGGLIFYGPRETGVGLPQLCVSISPKDDPSWSIHT